MLREFRRIEDFKQLTVCATDGDIGKPEEVYFDDSAWLIRYLVINTGGWLLGRRVLITPAAITGIDDATQTMKIDLTKQRVQDSPPVDAAQPISRQYEEEYNQYYGTVPYWTADPAAAAYPPTPRTLAKSDKKNEAQTQIIRETHLRSSAEVTGYYIEARDGAIGHVEDLIIDDEEWTIRYFEVDTRNWWPGKKVLVSTAWIDDLRWLERTVRISLARQVIQSAPEYNAAEIISRDYEVKLFEYYGNHHADGPRKDPPPR